MKYKLIDFIINILENIIKYLGSLLQKIVATRRMPALTWVVSSSREGSTTKEEFYQLEGHPRVIIAKNNGLCSLKCGWRFCLKVCDDSSIYHYHTCSSRSHNTPREAMLEFEDNFYNIENINSYV